MDCLAFRFLAYYHPSKNRQRRWRGGTNRSAIEYQIDGELVVYFALDVPFRHVTGTLSLWASFRMLPHGHHDLILLALKYSLWLPMLNLNECTIQFLCCAFFKHFTVSIVLHFVAWPRESLFINLRFKTYRGPSYWLAVANLLAKCITITMWWTSCPWVLS